MDIKEFLFDNRYIFIVLIVLLFLSLCTYLILHFTGKSVPIKEDATVPKLYCNNQCLNNGSCLELEHDYSCMCPIGYSGKNCNIYEGADSGSEIDIVVFEEWERDGNRHHGTSPGPSPPSPLPPAIPLKYNCCNTTSECIVDETGAYNSHENCMQDCNPTPVTLLRYNCCNTTSECIQDENGQHTKEQCELSCKKPVKDTCMQYGANKSPFVCKPGGKSKTNAGSIECPKASNGDYYKCTYGLCCDDLPSPPSPPEKCPDECGGKTCVSNCNKSNNQGIRACNKTYQSGGKPCMYHLTSHTCSEGEDQPCNNCKTCPSPSPSLTNIVKTNCSNISNTVDPPPTDLFPKLTNNKFNIRIKNTHTKPVTIWLDDLPFSNSWITSKNKASIGERKIWTGSNEDYNSGVFTGLRNYTSSDNKTTGNDWSKIKWADEKNKPTIERYVYKGNKWTPTKTDFIYRFFHINVNEVLVITPPHDNIYLETGGDPSIKGTDIKPYQCFYQVGDCDLEVEDNWRGTCIPVDPKDQPWYSNLSDNDKANLTSLKKQFSLNCGGAGIYITPCLPEIDLYDVIDTGGLSRIEYNINGGEIYFNLSAVDGINADYSVEFNGNSDSNTCDKYTKRESEVPKNCPHDLSFKNEYISSCESIKYWNASNIPDSQQLYPLMDGIVPCTFSNSVTFIENVKKIKLYDIGKPQQPVISSPEPANINDVINYLQSNNNMGETITSDNLDSYLAKCPGGDAFTKTLCHLWWDDPENTCAQKWINYASNSASNQQYSWAYDEMKISQNMFKEPIIAFDQNGNPLTSNPTRWGGKVPPKPNSINNIVPLLHCQLEDLTNTPTIDITISYVIEKKEKYTAEEITLCNSVLGDNSVCEKGIGKYCKSIKGASYCGNNYDGKTITPNTYYCYDKVAKVCNGGVITEEECMSNKSNIWCEPGQMGILAGAGKVDKIPCKKICTGEEMCPTNDPKTPTKSCPPSGCCDEIG